MSLNIPYSDINIRTLLERGHDKLREAHKEKSRETLGWLRAGSSGAIGGDNEIYGECHRIAHLRMLGVEKSVPFQREIMFQAGEGNEDLWKNVLVPAWDGRVLRGQEIIMDHYTKKIKGTTDIILADNDGAWKVILELKLVSATNSSIKRELDGEPDSKHLIQCGVYAWLTCVPVVLCYTNRTDFAIEFQRKKYGVSKTEPYYRMFYITFKDDVLYYRDEFSSNEVQTVITGQGIADYYNLLIDIENNKTLHTRPTDNHVNGNEAGWSRCDKRYCQFSEVCDRYEHDYNTWIDAAKYVTNE